MKTPTCSSCNAVFDRSSAGSSSVMVRGAISAVALCAKCTTLAMTALKVTPQTRAIIEAARNVRLQAQRAKSIESQKVSRASTEAANKKRLELKAAEDAKVKAAADAKRAANEAAAKAKAKAEADAAAAAPNG